MQPPVVDPLEPSNGTLQLSSNTRPTTAAVELLWPAIINIEDKRARRERAGKCSDRPARLVEGQRVMGRLEALDRREDDSQPPRSGANRASRSGG